MGSRRILHPPHRLRHDWRAGPGRHRDDRLRRRNGRFRTAFYDSRGNITREQLSVEGTTWSWVGTDVRCTGTLEDDGRRLVCHHERREGETWVPSMDVTLTRVD